MSISKWNLLEGLLLILIFYILAYFYFQKLRNKFRNEIKALNKRLSERSYQVMLQKWELERKNLSISQQNQDILDGLRYARNIQYAILPKTESIAAVFKDFFILYRPKDIVSGDFYFFEKKDDNMYLAIGDCTGHGVAGAFMSLVGSSLLSQIISQNTEPDEILNKLNEGIVEALRQKDSASHGGMDIAVIKLDLRENKLFFAGANRPLYLIRNNELEQIRPDKLPIGGFQPDENRKFNSREIQLFAGDRIYLSTDGYADQFGGAKGKKIMTKNFKELLRSIHLKKMSDQKVILETYFDDWKGPFEQVDDVLIFGFSA